MNRINEIPIGHFISNWNRKRGSAQQLTENVVLLPKIYCLSTPSSPTSPPTSQSSLVIYDSNDLEVETEPSWPKISSRLATCRMGEASKQFSIYSRSQTIMSGPRSSSCPKQRQFNPAKSYTGPGKALEDIRNCTSDSQNRNKSSYFSSRPSYDATTAIGGNALFVRPKYKLKRLGNEGHRKGPKTKLHRAAVSQPNQ